MRSIVAGLLTALILASMLVLGARGPGRPAAPDAPSEALGVGGADGAGSAEDLIRGLLRSAERGDVAGYLGAFASPLRSRLAREVDGRGRDAFAADLRHASAARKSHAVFAAEPDGDDAVRVTVETIYPDRNERQTYRVGRSDDGWRVLDVAPIKSHQPTARFGSPANYIAPEGVPIQPEASPQVGLTVESGDDPGPP